MNGENRRGHIGIALKEPPDDGTLEQWTQTSCAPTVLSVPSKDRGTDTRRNPHIIIRGVIRHGKETVCG